MNKALIRSIIGLLPALVAMPVAADPTEITVRVISQDAKFIGDHTGGADITLRNAKTGKILAKGLTRGGTGDTKRIMEASGRSPLRATPDAAFFSAKIDINEPTLVDLEVSGPVARPNSTIRVASQRWVMPGHPVTTGDGWTVELPGLAISLSTSLEGRSAVIKSKVELMCGCPITPGGLWDAADYRVEVSAWRGGKKIAVEPLHFMESPGGFSGSIALPGRGKYKLVIFARNEKTGNSGVAETSINLR